jgi:hypothetical protein
MSETTLPPLPPPPDPVKVEQWAGQIRTLVAVLSGAGLLGAAWAGVSTEQIANYLTAILTAAGLAGAAWSAFKSWRQKSMQRSVAVASAVASANAGVPVIVTVTPPGQPNTAASVSSAEIAAAPKVG